MSLFSRFLVLACLLACAPAARSVADEPAPRAGDEAPSEPAPGGPAVGMSGPEGGRAPAPGGQAGQPQDGDPARADRAARGPDTEDEERSIGTPPGPEAGAQQAPPPDRSMFPDWPQEISVQEPTVGGPTDRPPLNHDQPCGDGLCDGPESEQPDLCPRDCQDKPTQGRDWCGDDICDALEQRTRSCPKDCEGTRMHGPPDVQEGEDPAQGN
jgi:hypothetical protein